MKHPFSGLIVRYIKTSPTASVERARDELHVNLWELSQGRSLDIGIMLHSAKHIDTIQIDVPWLVRSEQVYDLGSRLIGEKIFAAIFNDVVKYIGSNDNRSPIVQFPNAASRNFVLIRLNTSCFSIELQQLADGGICTRLKIKLPTFDDGFAEKLRYLRFRISDIPETVYTTKFFQKDRNLLSSSLETRIVDFRINVRRGIPDDVLAVNDLTDFPGFKKIHFFLTVDRVRELLFSDENYVACRSLEDEDVWNSYAARNSNAVDPKNTVADYLGYQWTAKSKKSDTTGDEEPAKDLVALARFSQVASSTLNLVRFVILALLIGAAGNGLWNIGEAYIKSGVALLNKSKLFAGQPYLATDKTISYITILVILVFVCFLSLVTRAGAARIVAKVFRRTRNEWRRLWNFVRQQ